MGLGDEEIASIAATSTLVTICDFGWTGPWTEHPATEFTLQAWCGSTGSRGEPDRPPVAVGGDLGEFVAGSYAAFFALATHWGGGGRHVDLSVLEAMTSSMQVFSWLRKDLMLLEVIGRVQSRSRRSSEPGTATWASRWRPAQQWQDFCAMVECPDLADIAELRFQGGRWEHRDLIRARTADWFAARTVDEIVELAALFRIPMAAIGNGETLTAMDHFVASPEFRQPSGWLPGTAAAVADERSGTTAVRDAAGVGRDRVQPTLGTARTRTGEPSLPLEGLRVVDLTAFWAGPCATHLLATARRRRDQGRIRAASRRHAIRRRLPRGRRAVVGIQLGVPRRELG